MTHPPPAPALCHTLPHSEGGRGRGRRRACGPIGGRAVDADDAQHVPHGGARRGQCDAWYPSAARDPHDGRQQDQDARHDVGAGQGRRRVGGARVWWALARVWRSGMCWSPLLCHFLWEGVTGHPVALPNCLFVRGRGHPVALPSLLRRCKRAPCRRRLPCCAVYPSLSHVLIHGAPLNPKPSPL
eukprot:365111-Chlamydomonas_euryale.AAC.10